MAREHDVTISSVWATQANTNIPANPIPGFAYRRSDVGAGVIANGQGYTEIFDSALFNQMMWLLTSVGKTLCESGVMPFLYGQTYHRGAVALYTDYKLYQAQREIASGESPYPVPGDSDDWVEVMPPLYQGATAQQAGVKGLVPPALAGQEGMFLAGSGVWTSSSAIVPVGVILPFAGQVAPAGWLYCNGAAISRTAYADLFNAIGTAYGAGNGSSTFNLPDLRNRFAMGGGTMADRVANIGAGLPAITHTHSGTTASNGAHTHTATTASNGAHTHTANSAGAHTHSTDSQGNHTHTANSAGAHTHTRGTMEIKGQVLYTHESDLQANGAFTVNAYGGTRYGDHHNENVYNIDFQASRNWTGATSSAGAHTHTTTSNGAHTHTAQSAGAHTHSTTSAGAHTHTLTTASNGAHTHTMTTGNNSNINAIYGASSTVQPPAVKVNYIIKF